MDTQDTRIAVIPGQKWVVLRDNDGEIFCLNPVPPNTPIPKNGDLADADFLNALDLGNVPEEHTPMTVLTTIVDTDANQFLTMLELDAGRHGGDNGVDTIEEILRACFKAEHKNSRVHKYDKRPPQREATASVK